MRKILVGVLGAIVNSKGQFLLTKRDAPGKSAFHDKWQFVGGGMEFGEEPQETLVREFAEELSVKPHILWPHPLIITKVWATNDDPELVGSQVVMLVYIVSIGNQQPDLDNDPSKETSEWNWFSLTQVKNLDALPSTYETLVQIDSLIKQLKLT